MPPEAGHRVSDPNDEDGLTLAETPAARDPEDHERGNSGPVSEPPTRVETPALGRNGAFGRTAGAESIAATGSIAPTGVDETRRDPQSIRPTGGSSLVTHNAVLFERAGQVKAGLACTASVGVTGALLFVMLPTRPSLHYWVVSLLLGLTAYSLRDLWRIRTGRVQAATLDISFVGIFAVVVALGASARLGILSPGPVFLPIIVYFFGLTDVRGWSWTVYALSAVGHLGISVASALSLIPLSPWASASAVNEVMGVSMLGLLVQLALGLTFYLSSKSRESTVSAMRQIERARQQLEQRDVMLAEARAELEDLAGAGRLGRLSGEVMGDYRARELLGRGGMGDVYAGQHVDSEKKVALKVLHPGVSENTAQLERFFREALVCGQLDSPHVVRVLDAGKAIDGTPFLAMELLEGDDLAHALRSRGRMRLEQVVLMVNHVARALGVAHDAGVIHRDIKPQNIFRTPGPVWKVLDFGISKINEAGVALTQNEIIGTPGYMSPEQAMGEPVDARSDVFSLGAVIYRAITGRPAFSAPDPSVAVYNVLRSMPDRPSASVELPTDVDFVIALAMAKEKEKRFPTMAELATAFEAAADDDLPGDLRSRAKAVLASQPWGAHA